MTRGFLLISLIVLISLSASAQNAPKAELFGGYSYSGSGSRGFAASAAGNLNEWFGVVAEVGSQYSRLDDQGFIEKIRTHSFLFGPRFSLRRNKRVTPFFHTLFGVAKLRTETTEFGPLVSFQDTSLGIELGGGLDLRINDTFAIRAVQLDYLRTNFFGSAQSKGRVSAGLVVRFGRK